MVDALEAEVHRIEAEPGVLGIWSLPGGLPDAAAFDVARTVCRRAERLATGLMESGVDANPHSLAYLNELPFCMAIWKARRSSPGSRFHFADWR